jgi:hypothetical protein
MKFSYSKFYLILCGISLSVIFQFILLLTLVKADEPILVRNVENSVAIDNVCAWPSLTLLQDGSIAAIIFNKPSHGLVEGDVDCYVSGDGGRTWTYCGTPAPHEPKTIRMNHASGLSNDGSLVVLCSGWGGRDLREYTLPVMVSRSGDGGVRWDRSGVVQIQRGMPNLIPYGNIIRVNGGTLAVSLYDAVSMPGINRAYVFFSTDDGRTWKDPVIIGENRALQNPELGNYSDTSLLCPSQNRFLAVCRTYTREPFLELLISENRGRSWKIPEDMYGSGLTAPQEHPGHLLKLNDGRILLTYGIRRGIFGIGARISNDNGLNWGPPMVVISYGGNDGGFPSSVQLEDGTIVTAYYSGKNRYHDRYYMGVVRWKIPKE